MNVCDVCGWDLGVGFLIFHCELRSFCRIGELRVFVSPRFHPANHPHPRYAFHFIDVMWMSVWDGVWVDWAVCVWVAEMG